METIDVIAWVRGVLVITPQRWNNIISSMPTEVLTRQPKAGEWSALECLLHMTDIEVVFIERVRLLKKGASSRHTTPIRSGLNFRPTLRR